MNKQYAKRCAVVACIALAGCAAPYVEAVPLPFSGQQIVVLGTDYFDFAQDRETIETAGLGSDISAVAVRPLDGAARCSRVIALFANGQARDLAIGARDYLAAGQARWIDLPGLERNIVQLDMTCRPIGPLPVTVQVLASR